MKPLDLIAAANSLVQSSKRKPSQAALRRAVSSAYYALFHCVARNCADLLFGRPLNAQETRAWQHIYRALDHRTAKSACRDWAGDFPPSISDFATLFVSLQDKRHRSDYDPSLSLSKSEVIADIKNAEEAIILFEKAPKRDRRAFAALVLFKRR